ncbi:6478_t:CDS:1, partial [Dentiscutata heterogama]
LFKNTEKNISESSINRVMPYIILKNLLDQKFAIATDKAIILDNKSRSKYKAIILDNEVIILDDESKSRDKKIILDNEFKSEDEIIDYYDKEIVNYINS